MKQNRAWLYCRTAHETPEGRFALEQQEAFLRKYAEGHGYEVVGTTLEVATGDGLCRPGLLQVMEAADQKRMDRLLVFNWDRLARSPTVTTTCILSFRHCGVEIETTSGFPLALSPLQGIKRAERSHNTSKVL